jgi:AraC-like DNA-binding protein
MIDQGSTAEAMSFSRRREFGGFELRHWQHSARDFRCYSPDYELFSVGTWRGEVLHRRRRGFLDRNTLLCAHPGEVFTGRVTTAGSRTSLTIERDTLADYVAEHEVPLDALRLRALTQMSTRLQASLLRVHEMLRPGPSSLEIQTSVVDFVALLVDELRERVPAADQGSGTADRLAAERVRDCLHHDLSGSVNLDTVAKQTGMSRFRAVRVFKRWYGLPPYAYQLQVRLGLVQKCLRRGGRPADAAFEYGFVDQSHLTRHFRRFIGVTPARYARAG